MSRLLTPVGSTIAGRWLVRNHRHIGSFVASTFARYFAALEADPDGQLTLPPNLTNSGQAETLTLDPSMFVEQVLQ